MYCSSGGTLLDVKPAAVLLLGVTPRFAVVIASDDWQAGMFSMPRGGGLALSALGRSSG